MIVILCDSYNDACSLFLIFVDFLLGTEPGLVREIYDYSNCVETNEDLRYIFVDYRYKKVFESMTEDFIGQEDFFDRIDQFYEYGIGERAIFTP